MNFLVLSCCVFLAAGWAVSAFDLPEDHKSNIRELFEMFGKLGTQSKVQGVFEKELSSRTLNVLKFSWNDCGGGSYPSKVKDISVTPDPMRLPGNVNVSFKGDLNIDLKAPLNLKVDLQKKVVIWIPVPCLGQFGSCTYDDACQLLELLKCPPPFKKYGIPCECPIKKGSYSLPPTEFYIDDSAIPAAFADGHYKITAHMHSGDQDIACVHVEFAVAKS